MSIIKYIAGVNNRWMALDYCFHLEKRNGRFFLNTHKYHSLNVLGRKILLTYVNNLINI